MILINTEIILNSGLRKLIAIKKEIIEKIAGIKKDFELPLYPIKAAIKGIVTMGVKIPKA